MLARFTKRMDQDPIPQAAQGRSSEELLEKRVLRGLLIFFAAVIVYIPAILGGYIYDDDMLLTQNPVITRGSGFSDGESWKGLATLWFPWNEQSVNDYAPLSSTTLWIEWRLWGVAEPAGYHTTNILLHAAGALLLWAVLARIGVPMAWLAALLWALHPVGVESVAWISERRNVLSTPMLMLTLLAWLRFQQTRRRGDYALAVALFAGTLLAKSTVVMLPCFLLLWIWWKRNRVTTRDLIETAPFFLLSLALGLVTAWFQYVRAIADEQVPMGGLFHRIASACFALGFYIYKAVLPFDLVFNYPEWHKTVWAGWQMLPIVPFIAVFAWAWRERGTWGRHVILGIGFFAIMIVPALGIMKMAYMRIALVADHFEYMPMAGLIALAVAGAAWLRGRWRARPARYAVDATAAGVVILFCGLTWTRAGVFQDAEALWNDTLAKNPDAWQAHEHMGGILTDRGDLRGALEHFRRGVELRPYLGEVHNNYGNTLRRLGINMDEALEENRKAVELSGNNIPARFSYAVALERANHAQEAIAQYQEVLRMDPANPANPAICCEIGGILEQIGKTAEAVDYFREALQLAPDYPDAQKLLDDAMQRLEKERNQ